MVWELAVGDTIVATFIWPPLQPAWLSLQPCLVMAVTLVRSAWPTKHRLQPVTVPLRVCAGLKDFPTDVSATPFNQDTHRLLEVGSKRWCDGTLVELVLRVAH